MVVNAPRRRPHAVVFHELECGSYRADLDQWLELAASARGPVLDVGAGTGRVARALARAGHDVTALERDCELLAAVRAPEGDAPIEPIECVCADACSFSLDRRDFALCIVAMHTIQLFGGREDRASFLRCARAHLRSGGLLACAVLGDAEPFDCRDGRLGPAPESVHADGLRYVSTPVSVVVDERSIVIERHRGVVRAGAAIFEERDVVALARLHPAEFERELIAAGFAPAGTLSVLATDEHVGSEVVLARA